MVLLDWGWVRLLNHSLGWRLGVVQPLLRWDGLSPQNLGIRIFQLKMMAESMCFDASLPHIAATGKVFPIPHSAPT